MLDLHVITVPERRESADRITDVFAGVHVVGHVKHYCDTDHNGPWWNVSRALQSIVIKGTPAIITQDDMIYDAERLNQHLPMIIPHLERWPLVSMFTPPRAEFHDLNERGYNGWQAYEFFWAPFYMVTPEFAQATLEADKYLDAGKAKHHDEHRYSAASQRLQQRILTLIGSLGRHDLEIRSTLGTPAKIGKLVRDTQIVAGKGFDFREIRAWTKPGITPYLDMRNYERT